MRYTEHEQRLMDQQSGLALDRAAARRRIAQTIYEDHIEAVEQQTRIRVVLSQIVQAVIQDGIMESDLARRTAIELAARHRSRNP